MTGSSSVKDILLILFAALFGYLVAHPHTEDLVRALSKAYRHRFDSSRELEELNTKSAPSGNGRGRASESGMNADGDGPCASCDYVTHDVLKLRRDWSSSKSYLAKEKENLKGLLVNNKDMFSNTLPKRIELLEEAIQTNDKFFDFMFKTLTLKRPSNPTLRIRRVGNFMSQDYESIGSILPHLIRDWGEEGEQVRDCLYTAMLREVVDVLGLPTDLTTTSEVAATEGVANLSVSGDSESSTGRGSHSGSTGTPGRPNYGNSGKGPRVLVPGAGLGRLGYELMVRGCDVEMNECSRTFTAVMDYIYNFAFKGLEVMPTADRFSYNFHGNRTDQFLSTSIPSPIPKETSTGRQLFLAVGDFVEVYSEHEYKNKYDAIVTSFFIDTGKDLLKYIKTIDHTLKPGGVWINAGPLSYAAEQKYKLSYDEIIAAFESMGYTFVRNEKRDVPYSRMPGTLMYTEQYTVAFSTAVKGTSTCSSGPIGGCLGQ
eukprot:GFYU01003399.1.p2 GENE.GFYU01003399.1~~GFYU01003399.1.p2  ORF type:complete len:485 (-),score=103.43 GFYU01003399.1:1926-3380(-)